MDGGCHKHAHTLQHGHAGTNLIPNKHHKVIMSIALFICSAWLSRQRSVEMQTQVLTVWRHTAIIIEHSNSNKNLTLTNGDFNSLD